MTGPHDWPHNWPPARRRGGIATWPARAGFIRCPFALCQSTVDDSAGDHARAVDRPEGCAWPEGCPWKEVRNLGDSGILCRTKTSLRVTGCRRDRQQRAGVSRPMVGRWQGRGTSKFRRRPRRRRRPQPWPDLAAEISAAAWPCGRGLAASQTPHPCLKPCVPKPSCLSPACLSPACLSMTATRLARYARHRLTCMAPIAWLRAPT
jgi:hypothetical protein